MAGAEMARPRSDWLLPGAGQPRPAGGPALRARLVCFHYAGSGASMFAPWAAALPDEVELLAVQLPGRETRLDEPLRHAMEEVAPPLAEALAPWLELPYAMFGHSTGALIAFDVARRLRRRALPLPRVLIASAQNAPDVKPPVIRHVLDDAAFVEVLRGCRGTPEAILDDPVLLDLLLPRIRADGAVFETYRYLEEAPLDCPIVLFHGTRDAMVDEAGLARWARETRGGFRRRAFGGGHFFVHEQQAAVLDEINRELAVLLDEPSTLPIG
ncbi:thioesterase II family protein [Burkholderia gladioli]|uniref:thioesterase II family protein n=1 Tax=Burkholderia gladioli TaxID=28095 RepID=UPI0016413552|nr:alpha/beta fold hydrolase [Burkholderia gladioli]